MKNSFKKRILIFFVFFLVFGVNSIQKIYSQTSKEEIQFVQNLSNSLENGNLEESLKLFDLMPENLKNDIDLMCLKASLLLSAGKTSEAKQIGSSLLEKNPENPDILELNVMIAKQSGDKNQKNALLKKIISINPKNVAANIELADEQVLKKNWRNARDYYRRALLADPENTQALFGYAKMCYYMEKDDDAKNAFNKLIQLEPENSEAYSYLGKYEAESNQYRKALEYVNKAIELQDNNINYYFDKGTYLRYLGDYEGAEKSWKKAVSLEPDYFLGYAYLAGLYDEMDKTDLALEYYRKVVEKNPKYFYAYESLGMFAWKKGNWEEAQKSFEQALNNNPDSISYKLMITACLYKQNKIPQMKTFTESLMKKLPDRQGMEYKLVRMYHDKGGDADVAVNIQKETNRTKRGRYLFYLALYYELTGKNSLAFKYYNEVTSMESPMFFEYRLAQWATQTN